MPFLNPLASNLTGKIIELFVDQQGCCDDASGKINTCKVSVATTIILQKITIDGVEYTFTVNGTTPATIKAGIRESFVTGTPNAGYLERGPVGVTVVVNGANWDITVITTATVLKLVDSLAADFNFVCTQN